MPALPACLPVRPMTDDRRPMRTSHPGDREATFTELTTRNRLAVEESGTMIGQLHHFPLQSSGYSTLRKRRILSEYLVIIRRLNKIQSKNTVRIVSSKFFHLFFVLIYRGICSTPIIMELLVILRLNTVTLFNRQLMLSSVASMQRKCYETVKSSKIWRNYVINSRGGKDPRKWRRAARCVPCPAGHQRRAERLGSRRGRSLSCRCLEPSGRVYC